MQFKLHPERSVRHLLSAPFIYGMIIPLVIMDITSEIYHHICFPLYGIPLIKRNKYIKIDRQHLEYLSFFEKLNCMYCGYANGLAAYFTAIAGATEAYWCGIKHAPDKSFNQPQHHTTFIDYQDQKAYDHLTSD
jgi:hypothetical protein